MVFVIATSFKIFQHLLHLPPDAVFISTDTPLISSIEKPLFNTELSFIEAEEVIAISAKSISFSFENILEET